MSAVPNPEVLVIDDEVQIRRLLRVTLESAGWTVREAENGQLGLTEAAFHKPDAIILDLGLPDHPGLEVLRRLREWTQVPILILSVRDREQEKVDALDSGADDYLTKPFGGAELLARLRVLIRRAQPEGELSVIQFGDVQVDLIRRAVTKAGVEVKLSPKEYDLLRLLLRHRGKVITHRQLLRDIWGPNAEANTHYLRVYITHLRQKLETLPDQPQFIQTEAGVGYRLVAG